MPIILRRSMKSSVSAIELSLGFCSVTHPSTILNVSQQLSANILQQLSSKKFLLPPMLHRSPTTGP